jgi:hypothetical protein
MGTQITLVNNVPKLRITGRDLHPDPQELPVVQITGGGGGDGGSTACIANSIQASGTTTNDEQPTRPTNTLSKTVQRCFVGCVVRGVVVWWGFGGYSGGDHM